MELSGSGTPEETATHRKRPGHDPGEAHSHHDQVGLKPRNPY